MKLSSGSVLAFRNLYELNISSILRDILATSDLSHGLPTSQLVGGHCNQVWDFDLTVFLSFTGVLHHSLISFLFSKLEIQV